MQNKIEVSYFKSGFGELVIGTFNDHLVLCDWKYRKMRSAINSRISNFLKIDFDEGENDLHDLTKQQLTEYFSGERKFFDLPILYCGTDFQIRVWKELQNINYGETATYLNLSKKLGDEKAIRAVASANGANSIAIMVPCHRVIGSDGDLTGYAGGINTKRKLLELEGSVMKETQISLFENL